MTAPFHSFPSRRPRRARQRPANSQNMDYLRRVFAVLKREPDKIARVKQNIAEYQQQTFLPKGFIKAIERCEWVLDLGDNVDMLERAVFEDSDTGKRLRRYPLLFKGIINDAQ